ncbi:hypothetical protein ABZ214_02075 [Streptomyces iakyrus]
MSRPILFLDVDGPLNPYAAQPERRPDGYTTLRVPLEGSAAEEHRALSSRRRTLRVWLNPEHGRDLLRLDYVNPGIGLRSDDFRALADFARSLGTSRSSGRSGRRRSLPRRR